MSKRNNKIVVGLKPGKVDINADIKDVRMEKTRDSINPLSVSNLI